MQLTLARPLPPRYIADMVIGYHIIFGARGFWLPNDPRGSWSTEVWAKDLRPFGPATKVTTSRSLAGRPHDHAKRLEAKQELVYPAVTFSAIQIDAIAEGFAKAVGDLQLTVHACAILSDHVHLVTGRYHNDAEYVAGFLKRAATRVLTRRKLHPLEEYRRTNDRAPSPWASSGWFVYLNTVKQVRNCIRYADENPGRDGLPRQCWPFVVPYEPQ